MKKRFTDSDIWDDPWYRRLPCLYKEFWRFICDKCDAVGVWKVDLEGAGFFLGEQVSEKAALDLYNNGKERIRPIMDGERWAVIGFIEFQYTNLSPACPAHKPVYQLLERYANNRVSIGYKYPTNTLQEEDKDKDKDYSPSSSSRPHKDNKHVYTEDFESFWSLYPKRTGKGAAYSSWVKARPPLEAVKAALSWQKNTPQWTKDGGQYIPNPSTWLNQKRWEDERVEVNSGSGAAPIPGKYDDGEVC